MSEKISRRIFIGELLIIVLPLSLLLLIATPLQVVNTIEFFRWYHILNSLFAVAACVAVSAGLLISRTFVKEGSSELHNFKPVLWIFSFFGVALSLAAGISTLLPASPEYSAEEMFRNDFELFILGFPMLIPLIHLILERFLRKDIKTSMDSKMVSAA